MRSLLTCFLVIAVLMLGGCLAAPRDVQLAQGLQAQAYGNYLKNNERIVGTMVELYRLERGRNIDASTERGVDAVIRAVGKPRVPLDAAGQPAGPPQTTLTDAEARELVQAIITERNAGHAATDKIVARLQALIDKNVAEWAKAQSLTEALNEYMNAGLDESFYTEVTDSILGIMQDLKRKKEPQ